MGDQNSSKLAFITDLWNNVFYPRSVVILVGRNGITLSALKKNRVYESIFIDYNSEKYHQQYRKFIKAYKGHSVTFLLDHKECELTHEMLPILGSLIKTNPVDKFISDKYKAEDIVAYNVYEVNNQNGEVWSTCIAATPFLPPVSDILEYVIKKSFKYNGMYFLSLEFEAIIDLILQKSNNAWYLDHLQIFTIITRASGIRIVVKYKNNIMSQQTIEFPHDKSDLYLVGTIQQTISDKLLFYREYIKKLNKQTCVMFLVDNSLKPLISKLNFENSSILALSMNDLTIDANHQEDRFADSNLIEIFNNFTNYLASNKPLRSITKLTLINRTIFKPIIVIIFGMILALCISKYQALTTEDQTSDLNNQYYALSEEYRQITKKTPELSNAGDLIEIYNLQNIIARQSSSPFDHLKMLLLTQNKNLKISKLSWKLINPILVDLPQSDLVISLDVIYDGSKDSTVEGIEIINGYANHLKTNFQDFQIVLNVHSQDIKEVAKRVTIPAHFLIKGKVGVDSNDR